MTYMVMLRARGKKCAICRKKMGKKRFAVDHCHKLGHIRGLLCFRCNFGLSYFAEDFKRFQRAAVYLKNSRWKWTVTKMRRI